MKIFNREKEIISIDTISPISFNTPTIVPYIKNEAAENALKQVCYKGLLQVFLQLGIEGKESGLPINELRISLGIIDQYERLFEVLMSFLNRAGYIENNGGVIAVPEQLKADLNDISLSDSINQLIQKNIEYASYGNLINACLTSLQNILTGKTLATDIVFPDGSFDLVGGIYKGNYQADYFNELLADMVLDSVSEAAKNLPAGEKIRLLEVGAGTGGSSVIIFKKLAPYAAKLEYVYTDVSKSFLLYGDAHFSTMAPYLKTALFNIEQSPRNQNIEIGTFDLVIGTNVVHATKNIANTLQNIKALLKKDGLLMLSEIAKTDLFTSLTFGLLDGWWLYEDKELRLEGSPGLSAESWFDVLTETGFENPSSWPENMDVSQQVVVAKSDGTLVLQSEVSKSDAKKSIKKGEKSTTVEQIILQEKVELYLKKIFAKVLKMNEVQVDVEAPFESLGIDSIFIGMLAKEMSKDFGAIPATTFFEYTNISELSEYFIENHASFFAKNKQEEVVKEDVLHAEAQPIVVTETAENTILSIAQTAQQQLESPNFQPKKNENIEEEIAIIGLGGRYPGARNMEAFWENLKNGVDCISEIPAERFDIERFYDEEKGKEGKISTRYGGFIDGVAEFDALFFNIGPKHAERIDPQERLFLQTVWETIEDAGYTPKQLSQRAAKNKVVKTGVYVGVMYEEYQLLGAKDDNPIILGSSPASIANRVSYFCDFSGPSMAVDTMCSSSLTAIHLACKDLRLGEADLAIAGGVNVSVHQNKFLALSHATFLSAKGKCESFGNNGDGFVASEGVGAVLLKPLSKAMADGDHIYGVIKGTAVNHGGKNNGYTVPSVKGQASVVKEAMKKAGVTAEDFSYIEAHGTGTSLGDPVELAGLSRAFDTDKKQYCSIGSVKSNIGHCESAAGISGVTKVLLQLQHRQLVPSLHSSVLNENIDFANSPFKVQQHLADWTTENNRLRLAGISSFGAGGSNAHVIIEEYFAPQQVSYQQKAPAIMLVSAKNNSRLLEQVTNLKNFLAANINLNIYDIAYTLQVGREAMDERLAFVATDVKAIIAQLEMYMKGNKEGCFSGNVKKEKLAGDTNLEDAIKIGEPETLANLWVKGAVIDWTLLYPNNKPNKISLPTYAFARDHCWVSVKEKPVVVKKNENDLQPVLQDDNLSINGLKQEKTDIQPSTLTQTTAETTLTYAPVWEPINLQKHELVFPAETKHLLVTGNFKDDVLADLQAFFTHKKISTETTNNLSEMPAGITDVYLLQGLLPDVDLTLEEGIDQREIAVFKTVKSLLDSSYKTKKINITFFTCSTQKILATDEITAAGSGIAGLAGSLAKEQSSWNIRVIDLENQVQKLDFESILAIPFDKEGLVNAYRDGKVYERKLYPTQLPAGKRSGINRQGVYVLLGGAGGIGKVTTEYLVKEYAAQVIWLGRSALNDKIIALQDEIEEWGVRPIYISCDANNKASVEKAYEEITAAYPSIDGLFHSAIVLNDMLLKNMSEADFRRSFDPKSLGSHHFVDVFAKQPLDFICFYSSIESQSSAPGQANYAAGCTYKDAFAQSLQNKINTPTYIINWGYWGEVGVATGEAFKDQFELMGIGSIAGDEGMKILEAVLSNNIPQVTAIKLLDTERPAISSIVVSKNNLQANIVEEKKSYKAGITVDISALTNQLAKIAADTMGISVEEYDVDESFMDYGFDSISGTAFVKNINQSLDISLRPTDIFNHPNVGQLAIFIGKTFSNIIGTEIISTPKTTPLNDFQLHKDDSDVSNKIEQISTKKQADKQSSTQLKDVAIIGMSGQFGAANNLEEYWEALMNGKSLIEEVPADRWNIDEKFSADKSSPDKTYSKWGSFIKDIDKFDPLFFKISGGEAETMDPQQRLFLMHCWKAIEDAAINPRKLKAGKCGVYVGVGPGDYLTSIQGIPASAMWGNSSAILASRISYFLDLKGPAISIDSACSSSLVAMDLGCKSLQSGDADVVISGAVTIMNTANFYTLASKAGMLSPDGTCYTFDNRANGFVPGEGVGVVVMKRLEDAERDGDHIYGVIKGSMTNQDGATNGIFAPSALSQQELEQDLYKKFNIHPETISYVEAHGTGTGLGDPIEFEALSAAFKSFTEKKNFCGLGSVKTNIGHTLLAAGMAGVIKILLSLKHKQLPATLNYSRPNNLIDVENSPFKIQDKLQNWENTNGEPLRAAISSFGFSGTNAHMVLEEYQPLATNIYADNAPALIVLSAKNTDRLKDQAINLKAYLETNPSANIYDIAYTLQKGREAMDERLAIVTNNTKDLLAQLNGFVKGIIGDVQIGNSRKSNFNLFLGGEAGKAYIEISIKNKEHKSLAGLWVRGYDIDWDLLYKNDKPKRISLPTYPFAKDRYWLEPAKEKLLVQETSLQIPVVNLQADADKLPEINPINGFEKMEPINKNEITSQLIELFAKGLKVPAKEFNEEADLQEYGVDSISTMKLLQHAEEHFAVEIDITDLMNGRSIADLARIIEARLNSKYAVKLENAEVEKPKIIMDLQPNLPNKKQFETNYKVLIPDLERQLIDYKGIKLEVFIGGEGKETMVMLPPVDCTATAWMAQIEELKKKYQLIVPNYPGYGLSEFDPELATLSEIANQIIYTLNLLKVEEPVHLVGWSMGGFIAQMLAENYGEYFQSLTLVNTTAKLEVINTIANSTLMFENLRKDFVGNLFRLAPTHFANIDETAIKGSFNNQIAMFYAMQVMGHDYRDKLNEINIPVLIIAGGKDKLTPPVYSQFIHQKIKGSQYLEVKSAQHYIPLFHAQFFNRQLLKFLEENKVGGKVGMLV